MAIRPTNHRDDDREHGPFPPIFLCAVVLAVLIRYLEIYFFVTTTMGDGVFSFWQDPVFGPLGLAEMLLVCTLLILVVALLEAIHDPRNRMRWGAVVFCLLMVAYSGGIQLFSQQMQGGSY